MPFQFKKRESPAKAVRRVCRERIGAARERLREGGKPAAIHDVRREIKKLRAVFRLARNGAGHGKYRKSVKALRTAADELAAPRDARVMLKAFEKLAGKSAGQFPETEKALRRHCRREARRFRKKDSVAAADRILRKVDRRVGGLKIKASGWAAMEPGLRESYERGREASELVHRKPLPENFHDWRKHVKNLWYYFQLLRPAWPAEMRAMTDELESLAGQLGEDHDLFLLNQFATKNCAKHALEVATLNRRIESRQRELRAAALKLGSRLYAETPAMLCRRLENCWNLWHGKK
ncbi:MAG TPA: CHAD domain-containing protein [Verrucomicrobiae bacterium]|nr:CHAD domain-containing protein [Verrucomicrobiae bacterium]